MSARGEPRDWHRAAATQRRYAERSAAQAAEARRRATAAYAAGNRAEAGRWRAAAEAFEEAAQRAVADARLLEETARRLGEG